MDDPSGIIGPLLGQGIVGVLVVALVIGFVVPGWLYKSEKAQREALQQRMDDKIIPLIQETTLVLRDALNALSSKARR